MILERTELGTQNRPLDRRAPLHLHQGQLRVFQLSQSLFLEGGALALLYLRDGDLNTRLSCLARLGTRLGCLARRIEVDGRERTSTALSRLELHTGSLEDGAEVLGEALALRLPRVQQGRHLRGWLRRLQVLVLVLGQLRGRDRRLRLPLRMARAQQPTHARHGLGRRLRLRRRGGR